MIHEINKSHFFSRCDCEKKCYNLSPIERFNFFFLFTYFNFQSHIVHGYSLCMNMLLSGNES